MTPSDYIHRIDNPKITAVVIAVSADTLLVQGPYGSMTVDPKDWRKVPPVSELTNIWAYDRASGGWRLVRDTYKDNAARWLEILRGDDPGTAYKVSKRRPVAAPK
jgi:hypothetical protein